MSEWDFVLFLVAMLGIRIAWFLFANAHLINCCCKRLHLPCTVRVHRTSGVDDDGSDDIVNHYSNNTRDPYRFNVDVTVNGRITRFHGRY